MVLDAAPRTNNPNGRPSNVVLIDRLADARSQNADLRDELTACAQEMTALGRRIEFALMAGRPDVALHVAARLQVLGNQYANPQGDPDHAA
jgi:hypothetical protein